MPADKQSALAALDEWFSDAVKSASGTLYGSLAGKAASVPRELAQAETALRFAVETDKYMRDLIGKVLVE